jgi:hypothetical protein
LSRDLEGQLALAAHLSHRGVLTAGMTLLTGYP